jgi:hypothetical protein
MPNVTRNELWRGDMILTFNEWSAPELFVSLGQLLTPTGGGSAKYTHAQIVVPGDGVTLIAESHVSDQGPHVETNPPTTPGTVYRLSSAMQPAWEKLADKASLQALSLITYLNASDANEAKGQYNTLAAVYSLLRRERPDTEGKAVIQAVQDRSHKSGYFCSMFVVLCYQLAAQELGCAMPLDCNPEAMSPAALHGYVKRHPTWWMKLGTYTPG